MDAAAVSATGLTRDFGARRALDGVSISVPPGQVFALLGPNGGGKTTLFRILATLLRPTAGSFTIAGFDPVREPRRARTRLGVVFQSPSLDRKLTALENLRYAGALYGLSGPPLDGRSRELLRRFELEGRAAEPVEKLSGGLARRVEIAKALLHRPAVLLLDEPSTGLDPLARKGLRELLRALAGEGVAVLLTTHLYDEAEAADWISILDRGRLVAEGRPDELKRSVGGEVITLDAGEATLAAGLAADLTARFAADCGSVSTVDGVVRVERRDAHAFVPALAEAFPGRFRSLTLGAPTLEDVFVARTGHAFRQEDEEAA